VGAAIAAVIRREITVRTETCILRGWKLLNVGQKQGFCSIRRGMVRDLLGIFA